VGHGRARDHRADCRFAAFASGEAHVEALLGSPAADSLASASMWADEIRPVRHETAPWHYVNIELETAGYVAARDCPNSDCVVAQIDRDKTILLRRTGSHADQVEALKFLVHFIGDLHQPLHCANHHDRGGNELQFQVNGILTNLHRLWDIAVLQPLGPDSIAVADRLDAQISPAEALAWSKGTIVYWADQSFAVARDRIYAKLQAGGTEVRGAELGTWSQTAAVQLKRGGIRLAAMLNQVFANGANANWPLAQAVHAADRLVRLAKQSMPPAIISPTEAAAHVGEAVAVEGVVSEVHGSRSGMTFIEMGGRYPGNAFIGVVFPEDAHNFRDLASMSDRTVLVTGRVQLYRGKPKIVLKLPSQIKFK
jgi:hypothetical protein